MQIRFNRSTISSWSCLSPFDFFGILLLGAVESGTTTAVEGADPSEGEGGADEVEATGTGGGARYGVGAEMELAARVADGDRVRSFDVFFFDDGLRPITPAVAFRAAFRSLSNLSERARSNEL